MIRFFGKDGKATVCTLVDATEVVFAGRKTKEVDGYDAIVLGMGKKKHPTKAEVGKYKDLKFVPQVVTEFRGADLKMYSDSKVGDKVGVSSFSIGEKVNIKGVTKGKGFAGVVKRWGFKGGPKTHGQSDRQRASGSIGAGTTPGRVFKGKRMAGKMGNVNVTIKNLEVMDLDEKAQILCLKGSIPGANNSIIKIIKVSQKDGSN